MLRRTIDEPSAYRTVSSQNFSGFVGHARPMSDDNSTTGTPGARAVFITCLAVIAIGLILMIALPLMGR